MSAVIDAVQTSEQASLLDEAPAAVADCTLTFSGFLATHAHVAMKQVTKDGLYVPVVELHLEDVGSGHHSVLAQIPYLPEEREQAEQDAKRLHRGQRVAVTTQLADMRIHLPAARFVTQP